MHANYIALCVLQTGATEPDGAALHPTHADSTHSHVVLQNLGHDVAKQHLQVADEDGRASRGRAGRGCGWGPLAGPQWGRPSLHH